MDFISIGQNVQIKRSDGDIRSAVVVKIRVPEKSITAQWYECGQRKAKSIELEDLLRLNPELSVQYKYYLIQNKVQDAIQIANDTTVLNRREMFSYIAAPLQNGHANSTVITESTSFQWDVAQIIKEYRNTVEYESLMKYEESSTREDQPPITVCVRKKSSRNEIDVISVPERNTLVAHKHKLKFDSGDIFLENYKFKFDHVFDEFCDNEMVYNNTAYPLISTIFDGGIATCLAYGPSGTGKTYTMGGVYFKNSINAMALTDIFICLNSPEYESLNLVMSASSFEIFGGEIFDLLANKQKLDILEDDDKQHVEVDGLTEIDIDNIDIALKILTHSRKARASGPKINSGKFYSSYSHAVFQIILRSPDSTKVHGKFTFIDLAGDKHSADIPSTNMPADLEGAGINKSLLPFWECVRSQGEKLTQVLRESFIGEKNKICMIAMISSGFKSLDQTLETLHYAVNIKQETLKVNDDSKDENSMVDEAIVIDNYEKVPMIQNKQLQSVSTADMSKEQLNVQHTDYNKEKTRLACFKECENILTNILELASEIQGFLVEKRS